MSKRTAGLFVCVALCFGCATSIRKNVELSLRMADTCSEVKAESPAVAPVSVNTITTRIRARLLAEFGPCSSTGANVHWNRLSCELRGLYQDASYLEKDASKPLATVLDSCSKSVSAQDHQDAIATCISTGSCAGLCKLEEAAARIEGAFKGIESSCSDALAGFGRRRDWILSTLADKRPALTADLQSLKRDLKRASHGLSSQAAKCLAALDETASTADLKECLKKLDVASAMPIRDKALSAGEWSRFFADSIRNQQTDIASHIEKVFKQLADLRAMLDDPGEGGSDGSKKLAAALPRADAALQEFLIKAELAMDRVRRIVTNDASLVLADARSFDPEYDLAQATLDLAEKALRPVDRLISRVDDKAYGVVSASFALFHGSIQEQLNSVFESGALLFKSANDHPGTFARKLTRAACDRQDTQSARQVGDYFVPMIDQALIAAANNWSQYKKNPKARITPEAIRTEPPDQLEASVLSAPVLYASLGPVSLAPASEDMHGNIATPGHASSPTNGPLFPEAQWEAEGQMWRDLRAVTKDPLDKSGVMRRQLESLSLYGRERASIAVGSMLGEMSGSGLGLSSTTVSLAQSLQATISPTVVTQINQEYSPQFNPTLKVNADGESPRVEVPIHIAVPSGSEPAPVLCDSIRSRNVPFSCRMTKSGEYWLSLDESRAFPRNEWHCPKVGTAIDDLVKAINDCQMAFAFWVTGFASHMERSCDGFDEWQRQSYWPRALSHMPGSKAVTYSSEDGVHQLVCSSDGSPVDGNHLLSLLRAAWVSDRLQRGLRDNSPIELIPSGTSMSDGTEDLDKDRVIAIRARPR